MAQARRLRSCGFWQASFMRAYRFCHREEDSVNPGAVCMPARIDADNSLSDCYSPFHDPRGEVQCGHQYELLMTLKSLLVFRHRAGSGRIISKGFTRLALDI